VTEEPTDGHGAAGARVRTPNGESAEPAGEPSGDAGRVAGAAEPKDDVEPDLVDLDRLAIDHVETLNLIVVDRRSVGVHVSGGSVRTQHLAGRNIRTGLASAGNRDPAVTLVGVSAVAIEELRRLREVTVIVAGRDKAARLMDDERFVILSGPPGNGKRAAAISLFKKTDLVLDIDPSVSTEALLDFGARIKRDGARHYVIESILPTTAQALNEFAARDLTAQLRKAGAYLVITVDDRVQLDADMRYRAVSWHDRPDPHEALRRHLQYYLSEEDTTEILPQLPLDHIHPHLARRELRLIDRLARAVATAYCDGRGFDDAVTGLGLDAPRQAQDCLDESTDCSKIAFLIACTVLGGCSYATVSRHADELERLLAELSGTVPETRTLTRRRSARLEAAKARLGTGWVNTEFGPSITDTVALESAPLVEAVLNLVWHEYDIVREALLQWLQAAGGDRDAGVRIRCALAAGQLAEYDFGAVRSRLLLPWANSDSALMRASAAFALGVPAGETAAGQVLGLLRHWATVDNPRLVWTTLAAYGSYVGLAFPHIAMTGLLAILLRGSGRPADISQSVRRLFLVGTRQDAAITTTVLAGLTDWMTQPNPARQLGMGSFLDLLDTASRPQQWESRTVWNRLVDQEARPHAAILLAHCMKHEDHHQATFSALRQLLVVADVDEDVYLALQDLVLDALAEPGDPRAADRLTHYLSRWPSGQTSPRSASQLLTTIAKDTHR